MFIVGVSVDLKCRNLFVEQCNKYRKLKPNIENLIGMQ